MSEKSGKEDIQKDTQELNVQDHMGIICKLAMQYWPHLPASAKVAFDLEDMIGDIALQVLRVLPKYTPERGKQSTFVWSVARGHCIYLMGYFNYKSRNAVLTPIDVEEVKYLSIPERPGFASREGVEKIIERCSDDLRRALELLFKGRLGGLSDSLKEELLRTSAKYNVHYNDFLYAMRLQAI